MKGALRFTPEYGRFDDEALWDDLMKVREVVERVEGGLSDEEWEKRAHWKVLEDNPRDPEGERVRPSDILKDNDMYIAKVHLNYDSPENGTLKTEYWDHDYFWVKASSEYWDSMEEVFEEQVDRGILRNLTQGVLDSSAKNSVADDMVTSHGVPGFRIGRYIDSSNEEREYGHRIQFPGLERRFPEGSYAFVEEDLNGVSEQTPTRELEKEK